MFAFQVSFQVCTELPLKVASQYLPFMSTWHTVFKMVPNWAGVWPSRLYCCCSHLDQNARYSMSHGRQLSETGACKLQCDIQYGQKKVVRQPISQIPFDHSA